MLLTRDQMLAATAPPTKRVPVPELGGEILMRGLSGAERDAFEQEIQLGRGKKTRVNLRNIRAKLVALSAITEDGSRLFTPADVEALGHVRADILDRLFTVAQELSGLSEDDVEELEKNST